MLRFVEYDLRFCPSKTFPKTYIFFLCFKNAAAFFFFFCTAWGEISISANNGRVPTQMENASAIYSHGCQQLGCQACHIFTLPVPLLLPWNRNTSFDRDDFHQFSSAPSCKDAVVQNVPANKEGGGSPPSTTGQPPKYLTKCSTSTVADMRISLRLRNLGSRSRSTISRKSLNRSRSWTSSYARFCGQTTMTTSKRNGTPSRNKRMSQNLPCQAIRHGCILLKAVWFLRKVALKVQPRQ